MRKILSALVFVSVFFSVCKAQCDGNRYRNFIFSDFTKSADVVYGENINKDGVLELLTLDVYRPQGDISTERALIIISHGGFFLGGDKAGADVVPFCEDFAKMGYTVASINYRLGIEVENPLNEPYGLTVVRAVQDLRAAIRWFRQDAEDGANQFGIDPSEIYSGGVSAGGFMAIHLAYMDEDEIPEWIDMTAEGLEGGLEGESGNPGYPSDVNAIFSISGAIGDSAWIDAGELPACLFHGDNDQTVPFDSDTFFLFGFVEVTELDGSNSIDQKMDQVDIEHCFEVNEGYGHVPHQGNAAVYDTTLSIISNFLSHYICDIELDCSYRELEVGVGESQKRATSEVKIWPNPANDKLRVERSEIPQGGVENRGGVESFCIRDISGRIVLHRKTNRNSSEIDVSNLSSGMYLFEVEFSNGKMETQKLVIE
ncbi:MAG: T9SS type A sorting domain-containing protein [Flavobacteriales bacterium]|nr:T9SS type A sorting domain-containing protein [Flavobacteriales bacterium]